MKKTIEVYITVSLFFTIIIVGLLIGLLLCSQAEKNNVNTFYQNFLGIVNFIVACAALLSTLYIAKITNDLTLSMSEINSEKETQEKLNAIYDDFETINIISKNIQYFKTSDSIKVEVDGIYGYKSNVILEQYKIINNLSRNIKNLSRNSDLDEMNLAYRRAKNIYAMSTEFLGKADVKGMYKIDDFVILNKENYDIGIPHTYEQGFTNESLDFIQNCMSDDKKKKEELCKFN